MKLVFERQSRLHTGETAAEDDDVLFGQGRGIDRRRLGTQDFMKEIGEDLNQQTHDGTVDDPADKSGDLRAHLIGIPFGSAAGGERDEDDVDQAPPGNAQSSARHDVVNVGAATWSKEECVGDANGDTKGDAQDRMTEREHQSGGAESARGCADDRSANIASHSFFNLAVRDSN